MGCCWSIGPREESIAFLLGNKRIRDQVWLATSPLGDWRPRLLYRFAADETPRHLTWSEDGWISFEMERPNQRPAIWGIRAEGGTLTRRGPLPEACNLWTRLATAAPVGVCVAADKRPDVWVIEVPRLQAMRP
jgi:hypothetical protein